MKDNELSIMQMTILGHLICTLLGNSLNTNQWHMVQTGYTYMDSMKLRLVVHFTIVKLLFGQHSQPLDGEMYCGRLGKRSPTTVFAHSSSRRKPEVTKVTKISRHFLQSNLPKLVSNESLCNSKTSDMRFIHVSSRMAEIFKFKSNVNLDFCRKYKKRDQIGRFRNMRNFRENAKIATFSSSLGNN